MVYTPYMVCAMICIFRLSLRIVKLCKHCPLVALRSIHGGTSKIQIFNNKEYLDEFYFESVLTCVLHYDFHFNVFFIKKL